MKSVITYPLNSNQMVRNLQHLRRSGLISVDWHQRIIKREKPLREYVKKAIFESEMWPTVAEDWRKTRAIILSKRGMVNIEYDQILSSN